MRVGRLEREKEGKRREENDEGGAESAVSAKPPHPMKASTSPVTKETDFTAPLRRPLFLPSPLLTQ